MKYELLLLLWSLLKPIPILNFLFYVNLVSGNLFVVIMTANNNEQSVLLIMININKKNSLTTVIF